MAPREKTAGTVKSNGGGGGLVKEVHFRGVRKWPWGRYTAEIRDPGKKSRQTESVSERSKFIETERKFIIMDFDAPLDFKNKDKLVNQPVVNKKRCDL
ncbi:hypothetical protein Dsin_019953 [Dipteronia sinensis]|uniref:AP2/ERF domain-containing protein n=1 Tax=Dipteronia sinensis TaxID=43782 RepID=A0AAE0A8A3_9ROSI|nr:hypothetical protein Dsin_019953 [Dipteronia sinensis]